MLIFNGIIVLFIILSLAGTSGLFAERSGTVNIGINGMMIFGMIAYYLVGHNIHGTGADQLVAILAAAVAGALSGLLFGYVSISLKADQIIGGTAINLLSSAIALFMIAKIATSEVNLPDATWALSTNQSSAGAIFSVILVVGVLILGAAFIAIKFTPWGLRLKAAGENPQALDSQGVSVIKMRYHGIIISGALAGIAGGFLMQQAGIFTGNVKGLGFVGLAVLIAGQWRMPYVIGAALIFATIYSVAENITVIKVSLYEIQPLLQTLPFVLSLIALAIFSKKSRGPASSGVAYDKTKR